MFSDAITSVAAPGEPGDIRHVGSGMDRDYWLRHMLHGGNMVHVPAGSQPCAESAYGMPHSVNSAGGEPQVMAAPLYVNAGNVSAPGGMQEEHVNQQLGANDLFSACTSSAFAARVPSNLRGQAVHATPHANDRCTTQHDRHTNGSNTNPQYSDPLVRLGLALFEQGFTWCCILEQCYMLATILTMLLVLRHNSSVCFGGMES